MPSTLLLNADAQPISLLPLSAIDWQDAMTHLWVDDITVLHHYDDWVIRSPSTTIKVPVVAMMREQVTYRKQLRAGTAVVKPIMFLRDNFRCQYCGERFKRSSLTMDHVLPRKYGGQTKWENVTTACEECNWSRGSDVRIRPLSRPVRPTYAMLTANLRKQIIAMPHPTWNYYLGWPEDQVRYYDPRSGEKPQTDFDLA